MNRLFFVNNRMEGRGGDHMSRQCGICKKCNLEGIRILESQICLDCEQIIVDIHPQHPYYSVLVDRMKKIWNTPRNIMKM